MNAFGLIVGLSLFTIYTSMTYSSGVRMRLWSSEKGTKSELEKLTPSDLLLVSRLDEGYGFVTTLNTQKNVEISKKSKIGYIWSWLQGNDDFVGVGALLEETKSTVKSRLGYTYYASQSRNTCLSILGWPETDKYRPSKDRQSTNPLRSALIALYNFDLQSSLEYLKEIKNQERVLYSVLKNFTFETNKSAIQKISGQLSYKVSSPDSDQQSTSQYTTAILLFIAGQSEFIKVFEKLPFPDNLAFACIFFSDQQLRKSYRKLLDCYVRAGDLNGIVISGFDSVGIEIMERYLEATDDIQTIGLLSLTAKSLGHNKLTEWAWLYKAKLNMLELWYYRARLEIDERKAYKINQDNYKTSKCLYCGNGLSFNSKETDAWSEKDFGKKFISSCDKCPGSNNDLSCSVCLGPYVSVGVSMFDTERNGNEDLFVWCEKCNHAGHAEHLALWFQEYQSCPVVGCKCNCDKITPLT